MLLLNSSTGRMKTSKNSEVPPKFAYREEKHKKKVMDISKGEQEEQSVIYPFCLGDVPPEMTHTKFQDSLYHANYMRVTETE